MSASPSCLVRLKRELAGRGDAATARRLRRFFKTGPGEYAEGERFRGITVPVLRALALRYGAISLRDTETLLHSPFHEERLLALLILVQRFPSAAPANQRVLCRLYLRNTSYINNWDLVDLSAYHIVGEFFKDKSKAALYRLARSPNIWDRRIAMVATFAYIKEGHSRETLNIAKLLLNDEHDLIHKAVGWMLREVGKRCSRKEEEVFLRRYSHRMPRTMLRYAIERFPPRRRQYYLRRRHRAHRSVT